MLCEFCVNVRCFSELQPSSSLGILMETEAGSSSAHSTFFQLCNKKFRTVQKTLGAITRFVHPCKPCKVSFWLQGLPLKLQSLSQFRHVSLQPNCFGGFSCSGHMGTAGLLSGAQRHCTSSSSGRDQELSGTVRNCHEHVLKPPES